MSNFVTEALVAPERPCLHSIRAENERLRQQLSAQRRVLTALSQRAQRSLQIFETQLHQLENQPVEAWVSPLATFTGEVQGLSSLVSDTLLLQKLEAGQIPLDLRPLPTLPLIELVTSGFGERLVREFASPLPPLLADSEQTEAVLMELLGRARRHSEPNSPLIVGAAAVAPKGVRLWVAAQRFVAADSAEDFAPEIALCCKRVEIQGGGLTCERRSDGFSAVVLQLPAAAA
ncbi:hypothetical protein [Leptolyngbya sp. FACHB-261]|uniref:hypothetical protein n=1 Tax=Leptolyngbya sp. FACHB-261 TaxID=2692806 RepID=UPI001684410C|nr:hypothetical protein [Leptolyngbya sp. FACHB-261]MBD2099926.1 hypothetical protein [Leptolyngbya sp. FACHB-261]